MIFKYSYPQGDTFDIGSWLSILKYSDKKELNFNIGDEIQGVVTGYDNVNMWIVIKVE